MRCLIQKTAPVGSDETGGVVTILFADGTRGPKEMQRITGDIREEILADRTKNSPIGVKLREIPIGLHFRHSKRFSALSEQPGDRLELRLHLITLREQGADGKRCENQER